MPVTEHGSVVEQTGIIDPFVRGIGIAIPTNQILNPVRFIVTAISDA